MTEHELNWLEGGCERDEKSEMLFLYGAAADAVRDIEIWKGRKALVEKDGVKGIDVAKAGKDAKMSLARVVIQCSRLFAGRVRRAEGH